MCCSETVARLFFATSSIRRIRVNKSFIIIKPEPKREGGKNESLLQETEDKVRQLNTGRGIRIPIGEIPVSICVDEKGFVQSYYLHVECDKNKVEPFLAFNYFASLIYARMVEIIE